MDVSVAGARGEISLYVGVPDGEGSWPAALVISDARGVTTNVRNQVDWLAAAGYLAAAPDLAYRGQRVRCLFSTMRQALRGEGAVSQDFETVRSWLANHEASTGRVAVAGFCFDGGFALLLAGGGGFDVVGCDYGGLTGGALATLATSCPVLGRKSAHGNRLKKEPAQIAEVLWAHSVPHEVAACAAAGHTFMNASVNASVEDKTSKWALIMGEMSTTEPYLPSALDTRRRIKSFFDAHMAG